MKEKFETAFKDKSCRCVYILKDEINLPFSHACTVTSVLGRLKHVPVTEETVTL